MEIYEKTVKTICGFIQVEALTKTSQIVSIKIVEATESPGQPMAHIELRQIRKNQREDVILWKWVRETIDKKLPRDNSNSSQDQIMKRIVHRLKMIRGILYREMKDGNTVIQQLVLPKVYNNTVFQGQYNDVGHPGRDRTFSLIRERFYWPRMTADIDKWTSCRRRKSLTNNRTPLVNIVTTYLLNLCVWTTSHWNQQRSKLLLTILLNML